VRLRGRVFGWRLGLADILCEALTVEVAGALGAGETAAAADTYASLIEASHLPGQVIWRIQGLLARELAVSVGTLSLLADIDLETAQAHLGRADLDLARDQLTASLDACRRYGVALLPDALAA
jgi:hypothetical protein